MIFFQYTYIPIIVYCVVDRILMHKSAWGGAEEKQLYSIIFTLKPIGFKPINL